MKDKRPSLQDLKKKVMEIPEVKKGYDRLAPVYQKIRRKIKQRIAEEEAGCLDQQIP